MAKLFALASLFVAVGIYGVLYLVRDIKVSRINHHTAAPATQPAAAAAGQRTGFVGDSGYLMEVPAGYEVYAEMRGTSELVIFYPKGTKPVADEKQYQALGIVRLEVSEPPQVKGGRATLGDLKKGVLYTLDNNKETYTQKDLSLALPAFQVDITRPNPITQLFLGGKNVFYVFTGGDEKLMLSMAESVRDDAAGLPKVH